MCVSLSNVNVWEEKIIDFSQCMHAAITVDCESYRPLTPVSSVNYQKMISNYGGLDSSAQRFQITLLLLNLYLMHLENI